MVRTTGFVFGQMRELHTELVDETIDVTFRYIIHEHIGVVAQSAVGDYVHEQRKLSCQSLVGLQV